MSDKIQDNKIKTAVKSENDRYGLEKGVISAIAPKKIEYNYTDLSINFLKNRQK